MSVVEFPHTVGPEIKGAELCGHRVIIEGRAIPRLVMFERGDEVEFVLDGRLLFTFPAGIAHDAAHFAASAMAIGEGYPCISAETKERSFAPQVMEIGDV